MSRREKHIYLTFDDGPIEGLTEWVVKTLKQYQVKATFFCVGANILKNPSVYQLLKEEGHVVANHTMYHSRGFKKTVGEYLKEVEDCRGLTGNNLFRPPYGQLKIGQYRALVRSGYRIILWDVISYDYENISVEQCEKNVMKHARNGSIVLFHDNIKAEKNIRHALPIFLEHFVKNGYAFRTF